MKSRWTTRLLLAAVVAVWSVVAWRIFAPAKPDVAPMRPAGAAMPITIAVADTLHLDYPDPFLKGTPAPKPAARQVVRRLPPAKKAGPKRCERVPFVHLATVTAGGQALHVLAIGSEQYELRAGDTTAGFRLHGADTDSLYFCKDGRTYGVERCRP